MKERPLLFTPENAQKSHFGTKTQTRRIVKPQPEYRENESFPGHFGTFADSGWNLDDQVGMAFFIKTCPYGQVGDRLIVSAYIHGIPHTYCAGTDGNIYSRAKGTWRQLKAHSGNPYPCVTVMVDGKKCTKNVHSLICAAFYGPPPSPHSQVRHLDGDYKNSLPDNLCWGTQAENWRDRKAHGNGCEGEKHHAAKFNDEERAHIRWAVEKGLCSQRQAARALGISQGSVSEMMAGNELNRINQELPVDRIGRTVLEITEIRVQRLQEISEEDAVAEGCLSALIPYKATPGVRPASPRIVFSRLWDSINGPGSWDANPWVWAITFKKVA